jgi:hypothetical protein
MAHKDGMRLKAAKTGRIGVFKTDSLWVHRGVMRPFADFERVIEQVRNERIASVSKGLNIRKDACEI